MTASTLSRIMARHQLARADILAVVIFAQGHPAQSFTRALWAYLHGEGPAAAAMGRAGVRRLAAASSVEASERIAA